MDNRIIGIVAHPKKAEGGAAVRLLDEAFRKRGIEPRIDRHTAEVAGLPPAHGGIEDLAEECGMIVTLGGDGLILHLAHRLRDRLCPIFGLNLGMLGFLTCMRWPEYIEAVDVIAERRYTVSERSQLEIRAERGGGQLFSDVALNDLVISRGVSSQLIRLQTWINADFLTEYHADGLIVATPTGSTAYSLSAGGPILSPDSGVFVITPICPHVLTNRSVITPDDAVITVEVEHAALVSADGREGITVESGDKVIVKRSDKCLPLVTLPGLPFYSVLREKMRWAGSNRRTGQG